MKGLMAHHRFPLLNLTLLYGFCLRKKDAERERIKRRETLGMTEKKRDLHTCASDRQTGRQTDI